MTRTKKLYKISLLIISITTIDRVHLEIGGNCISTDLAIFFTMYSLIHMLIAISRVPLSTSTQSKKKNNKKNCLGTPLSLKSALEV